MATRTDRKEKDAVRYSVHPSIAHRRAIIGNLPGTTGRSLDAWIRLLKREGPAETRERKAWLKNRYELGGTTASLIVERAEGRATEEDDTGAYLAAAVRYVDEMFAGLKAPLRPMHDAIIRHALKLRKDLKVSPCRTMVPLYRHHVIAQIKPTTRTRLDFGLALKGAPRTPPRWVIPTGGLEKGDRITHRIGITHPSEITPDLWKWFEIAYELDG